MNAISPIQTGVLYVVATPIGNLQDLSPRAQTVLQQVSLIAAEDTRHSRPLLQHFAIQTPLLALHEHNEQAASQQVLQRLRAGESIALISDAGTPLISDPGARLVAAAHAENLCVSPIPGPSAVIAALSAAGLPADRFLFAGFPPAKGAARRAYFADFVEQTHTLVFYEAPHRILDCLTDLQQQFGAEREAVLVKELSKIYETVRRETLAALLTWLQADALRCKGEFVIIIAGAATSTTQAMDAETERLLQILVAELPLKQASKLASKISGLPKNQLYAHALAWQNTNE